MLIYNSDNVAGCQEAVHSLIARRVGKISKSDLMQKLKELHTMLQDEGSSKKKEFRVQQKEKRKKRNLSAVVTLSFLHRPLRITMTSDSL